MTVACPLDCPYLQEARKHEPSGLAEGAEMPNRDIRITEEFLEAHQPLLLWASKSLAFAAFETPGAVDNDVRAALEALIRTQRTLQSGVVYESRPDNMLADRIFSGTLEGLDEHRKRETEKLGMSKTRDVDVLGMLVFLQRLEVDRNNGRPKGRAFMDYLRRMLEVEDIHVPAPSSPSLIL